MKKEMTSSLELMPDPKVVAAKVRMLILRVHCPQGPSGTLNPTSFGEEPSGSSQSSTERRCKECMENT